MMFSPIIYYLGFGRDELLNIAKEVKDINIKTKIYEHLKIYQCPKCDTVHSVDNNFCAKCGFNLILNLQKQGYDVEYT